MLVITILIFSFILTYIICHFGFPDALKEGGIMLVIGVSLFFTFPILGVSIGGF